MRNLLMFLATIALLACSATGESDKQVNEEPGSDVRVNSQDTTLQDVAEAPDTLPAIDYGAELPIFPEVTFVKPPYLQWPTKESVTLLAETNEETPLHIILTWEGGATDTITTPTEPEFTFLTMPMDGLDGFFHQADIKVPEGIGEFTLTIANAPDYKRDVELPQYLDSFTMIAFGDTRTNDDIHQEVSNQIVAEEALIVFQTGDLMDSGLEVAQWNNFFKIEAAMLESSFYFPIFGNHEVGGDSYYYTLFETRNSYDSERNWYAEWGPVGFIGIEQYKTRWAQDEEALLWLEETLIKLQDKRYLIFSHHEPMYTFSNHGPWLEGREVIQPLLEEYGVDLVLSGHNHCYERFEVNGIPYIVTGGGGAPLYSTGTGPEEEVPLFQNWGKFYHYLRLEISDEKIHVTVIDTEEQSVFEEFDVE
jgi:predicted MPP superfamily phosphohydrolase